MELTQELVKNLFDYHEDGYLIWKVKPRQNVSIGDRAGHLTKYGERSRYKLKIYSKCYFTARIIFLWHKGYLPPMVDHRDRNKLNDRINNLRESDALTNARNVTSNKGSSSKYLGVYKHNRNNCWCACIGIEGKNNHLGSFDTEEKAALAYNKAASFYYGDFANLNIICSTNPTNIS